MKILRHAGAALVLVTLVLLVAACGNKGDLVRPEPQPDADAAKG
jgi:predicted small lipoprotein YifL